VIQIARSFGIVTSMAARSARMFFLIVNDRIRARLSLIRSLFFPVMRARFPVIARRASLLFSLFRKRLRQPTSCAKSVNRQRYIAQKFWFP
jgi:hypothetical protein